jgi:NADH dehydrogenase
MEKTVLTGATGFIGGEIARQAQARGIPFTAIVRSHDTAIKFANKGVDTIVADIAKGLAPSASAAAVETIVNAVGIIREEGEQTFDAVHYFGVKNLLAAFPNAARFVQVSALGTRPNAPTLYHRTKQMAEDAITSSGMAYTILRPSIVFGPDDKFVNILSEIVKKAPIIPILGPGTNKMQPIFVEDVARMALDALTLDAAANQVVEVAGADVVTLEEIMDFLADHMRAKKQKIHIPLAVLSVAAATLGKWTTSFPITTEQIQMLKDDNVCDIGRMKTIFGIEPKPFKETVRTYLAGRA